jgi:hypothetical protein
VALPLELSVKIDTQYQIVGSKEQISPALAARKWITPLAARS